MKLISAEIPRVIAKNKLIYLIISKKQLPNMVCKFLKKLKRKMSTKDNNIEDENLDQNGKAEETANTEGQGEENSEQEVEELDEMGQLQLENETVKNDLGESKNKFLRLYAEFDNYKKRSTKERIDTIQTAGKKVILDFLPVLDDFNRALKTNIAENEAEHNEGFNLILQKLKRILENHGVVSMDAMGGEFNADLHDAISEIEAGDEMAGKIVDVIEEGYYMNDILIRHAKVVVGR